MNFGPLSRPGGWRRLNVAITRARYRTEIVSSIRAGDIPESVTGEGLRHLRRYLDYATSGLPALAPSTRGDAGSPFEESVIDVIRSWGYALTPRVGAAGYRIDIGIHYPSHPGVYALGVECDGHRYHSAKAARDRDRLREQVLRDLGWNLHRIWGTSWYRDRKGEERRLQAAIEHAMAAPVHGLLGGASMPTNAGRPVIQTEAASIEDAPGWATPYVTAAVPALPHWVDPATRVQFPMTDGIRVVVATAPSTSAVAERLRTAGHIGGSDPYPRYRCRGRARGRDPAGIPSPSPTRRARPCGPRSRPASGDQVHDDDESRWSALSRRRGIKGSEVTARTSGPTAGPASRHQQPDGREVSSIRRSGRPGLG
jgi:hypothetical protein